MKRYCEISVHGLVGTAFFALAMTGRLDLLSIAIFTPALAVSLYRALKALPPLLAPRASFYLSIAYVGIFLLDFSMYSRSLIGAASTWCCSSNWSSCIRKSRTGTTCISSSSHF